MTKPLQVLFLCAGNTCRSPLVEGLARRRYGGAGAEFRSAGLSALEGEPASEGSLTVAAEQGVDLTAHRSRPFDARRLDGVDWVIAMTRAQARHVAARAPGFRGRIGLLGLPGVDLRTWPGAEGGEDVADPYGGDLAAYHRMAEQVERLLDGWRDAFAGRGGPAGGTA